MTEDTDEARASRIVSEVGAKIHQAADLGDEVAIRRTFRDLEGVMRAESPAARRLILDGLAEQETRVRRELEAIDRRKQAGERIQRLWREKYPDAENIGDVIDRAVADGNREAMEDAQTLFG